MREQKNLRSVHKREKELTRPLFLHTMRYMYFTTVQTITTFSLGARVRIESEDFNPTEPPRHLQMRKGRLELATREICAVRSAIFSFIIMLCRGPYCLRACVAKGKFICRLCWGPAARSPDYD